MDTLITIAGRTYEVLSFLRGNERYLSGSTIVERAKEMNANLGKDDGQHLLDHQDEIPAEFRNFGNFLDRTIVVFTEWRHPDDPKVVAFICWHGLPWHNCRWAQGWISLNYDYLPCDDFRVLRRKSQH